MNTPQRKLLYYCDMSAGGIVDYVRYQAEALSKEGIDVTLLCPVNWEHAPSEYYEVRPELIAAPSRDGGPRWQQRVAFARTLLKRQVKLASVICQDGFNEVLFASYTEYLAPLWAGRFRRLANSGVVFGAVVHDPVRDFVVGPVWWHRWSIANGYSFLREAFVHAPIRLDTVRPMLRLRTTIVPIGPYPFIPARRTRAETRAELDIPQGAQVMLSFGHIRDGKNLDLVLRMMVRFPGLYLVVAGKEQSGGQKPLSFYRALASELDVESRCRWLERFVPEDEIGGLFASCDLVLLIYSALFRSASSVLGAAIAYRKPCLASGGEGNLSTAVTHYGLGWWIKPDDLEALCGGIQCWLHEPVHAARWDDYERENSWARNAAIVADRLYENGS